MIWEERWHPLREEWVIIAAHRQDRPWSGETKESRIPDLPPYENDCYLCPGNRRVSGKINPDYKQIFVFDNDHPSVAMDAPTDLRTHGEFYRVRPATGIARVVCYNPLHNLTLAELEHADIVALFQTWAEQYADLAARPEIEHIMIFENKGTVVGVSNPHPHCQIYANNFVYPTTATEVRASRRHFEETGRTLFQDIIRAEKNDGRRIIAENDSAIAFLPFFARYAYEVYVAPKETYQSIDRLSAKEMADLAYVLKQVLVRFDNLWQMPFPYVMPLQQAPATDNDFGYYHFHIKFHPPLRKPNLLKYLGGPETGGGTFLSDTSPEEKAAELLAVSNVHYKLESSK